MAELTLEKKGSTMVGSNGILKGLENKTGKSLEQAAIKRLIEISVAQAKIINDMQKDKDELKSIKIKLAETKIGQRMEQLAEDKKKNTDEMKSLKAGFEELLRFFKTNGVKIDLSKVKMIEG